MARSEPGGGAEAGIDVRRAEPADGPTVAETFLLARTAAIGSMPPVAHSSASVTSFWCASVESMEIWVVVSADGEQQAFLALDEDWLHSVYVRPEHQGAGLGGMLLDLAKVCRPGGFGLWVFTSNLGARALYARHGLVEVEHTDGSGNEERAPDVRMEWHPKR